MKFIFVVVAVVCDIVPSYTFFRFINALLMSCLFLYTHTHQLSARVWTKFSVIYLPFHVSFLLLFYSFILAFSVSYKIHNFFSTFFINFFQLFYISTHRRATTSWLYFFFFSLHSIHCTKWCSLASLLAYIYSNFFLLSTFTWIRGYFFPLTFFICR